MKEKGISLIVLIITIVIILILSTAIIMAVINNNPISSAKEAVLRNDLQVMKEAYGIRTGELLLKYEGDKSKIKVEDYADVVQEKYKGEVEVFEEGLAYLGKNKKKQEVAEQMGYIIGNPNDAVLRSWTGDSQDDFHKDEYRGKITKITFITSNKVPNNVIESWDVSEGENGGVMAWVVSNGEEGYELTIGGNTKVVANADSSCMLYNFTAVKEIDIKVLDTSNVIGMNSTFQGCSNLVNIDLSKFDTSNVTSMDNMFKGCESLTNLDLSSFETGNVGYMYGMFSGCKSLTNLDVSNFSLTNVHTIREMFKGCESLTNLDLSSFANATKLIITHEMFEGCTGLVNLDISNLNTSKVTDMHGMFSGCKSLTSLDLSSFDTNNVTAIHWMFYGCESLTSLDLSNFYISKVADMDSIFCGCSNLTNLDISNFDTSKVTNMQAMFEGCTNLKTELVIRNLEETNYDRMFSNTATSNDSGVIVNYTSDTSDLVDEMLKTKSENSNVEKGEKINV